MKAFLYGVPIGMLGGLIGLGGAEFRLPVLTGVFRYSAKQAIPLNLAISLFTVVAAFSTRASLTSLQSLLPIAPLLCMLGIGSMVEIFGRVESRRRRLGDDIGLQNRCSTGGWARNTQGPMMSVGEINWSVE